MKANQRGFALAILLALLPVVMATVFLGITIMGITQFELRTQYGCRNEALRGQERVAAYLKKLMALNPKAQKLKVELIAAQAHLVVALGQGPLAIANAHRRIANIKRKQRVLDIEQTQLIAAANSDLHFAHSRMKKSLQLESTKSLPQLGLMSFKWQLQSSHPPRLAVKADSSDTAPTYSLTSDFENDQALAQKWLYEFHIRAPFRQFLNGQMSFKRGCSVTLKRQGATWVTKVKKDRS